MIRYICNVKNKTIELLNGGSIEELKDLCNKFEGYSFILADKEIQSGGILINGVYTTIVKNKEHG